jgi:hypothetical protein
MLFTSHNTPHITLGNKQCLKVLLGGAIFLYLWLYLTKLHCTQLSYAFTPIRFLKELESSTERVTLAPYWLSQISYV